MSDNVINNFRGENFFLSNFYMAPVMYDGITYTNSEAAFQAQKCANYEDRKAFMDLNPSDAKHKGRHVLLRDDWDKVKISVMYNIVKEKFVQNPVLRLKLMTTGAAKLEEDNTWGDKIWGTVKGIGENNLGKILMQVREELYNDHELIVIEKNDGMYSGYILKNNCYAMVFNSDPEQLFTSIKNATDTDYIVTCLDKSDADEFMMFADKQVVIWRYDNLSPFAFGGSCNSKIPVSTKISLFDYKVVQLHKGFVGIVIDDGPAKGVYELRSGGLVGDTVEDVNSDIDACADVNVMLAQIDTACNIRNKARLVLNEAFGLAGKDTK